MIGVGVQIRLELEDEELPVVLELVNCLVAGKDWVRTHVVVVVVVVVIGGQPEGNGLPAGPMLR